MTQRPEASPGASSPGAAPEVRRIGVTGSDTSVRLHDALKRLQGFASSRGIALLPEEGLAETVESELGSETLSWEEGAVDFIVALGGDGTLLRTGRLAAGLGIPVLGINLGHLGFLTASPAEEMEARLEQVLAGDYHLDWRSALEATVTGPEGDEEPSLAWNDVVVHKRGEARVTRLSLSVEVRGEWQEVGSFSADGVIVATPTGSTAYSLSAGGPIVDPSVECMIVTPICPHTIAVRPLVVPATQRVRLQPIEASEELVLSVDGQVVGRIGGSGSVQIAQAGLRVPLIRFPGQNFYETISRKLDWAARPRGGA